MRKIRVLMVWLLSIYLVACGNSAGEPQTSSAESEESQMEPQSTEDVESESMDSETPATDILDDETEETESSEEITYTYTEMSTVMYTTSALNVRDLPCVDGEKLGVLSKGQEVQVIAQCQETGWYRIAYGTMQGYVSNKYLTTIKPEDDKKPESEETEEKEPAEEIPKDTQDKVDNYIYYPVRDDLSSVGVYGNIEVAEDNKVKINSLIRKYGKRVSFKLVPIDGTACISYNSSGEYFAASTIKAAYLLYCYQMMDQGNGSLDETMVYTSEYYWDGTGDMQYSPEGTVYTLKEIMYRVMWNSDNVAYNMCVSRWGKDGYNRFIEELGCSNLKLTSEDIWVYGVKAEDFIIVWKKIYEYFQTDSIHAKAFYDSVINTKNNVLQLKDANIVVAQKYGQGYDVFCDTALVYGKNTTYMVSIFTESYAKAEDKEFIKQLANLLHEIVDK